MISIVITAFKEPKTIGKAIESIINQEIIERYELYVVAPDKETLDISKKYQKKNRRIKLFKDPGKGKSYALNLLISKLKGGVIIFTDGDVFVSNNSIKEILEIFKDKRVGCVTGRPIPLNSRDNMFGYWSHLLCYAAHKMRLKRDKEDKFLECSGYLWAFRNNTIRKIPRETAEDTIVPYLFWKKNYKIKYAPKAEVFVKFPLNLHDFVDQKKRTAKGHEALANYVNIKKIPRMKSLKNEILESYELFIYPKNINEVLWTFLLFPLRLYIWILVFFHYYLKKDIRVDGWQATKSTK